MHSCSWQVSAQAVVHAASCFILAVGVCIAYAMPAAGTIAAHQLQTLAKSAVAADLLNSASVPLNR